MCKYHIIGSGIVGCTIARELVEAGHDVVLYERRNHVGGNLYDEVDEHGINIHIYGPHIFHTNNEKIYKYVSKYCELQKFDLVCGSVMDDICVTTSFDFSSVDAFFPEKADKIKSHIKNVFGDRKSATVLEMLDSDDEYVKMFADFLYEKDYKLYTAKQWGISPDKIDKQIFKRVPILFSYGSKYFSDKYQAMPVNGYRELIDNLLDHENVEIKLNIDALDIINFVDNKCIIKENDTNEPIIYTGPLDELFSCKYGRLPYRSLRFEWKYEDIESKQKYPVVAYPQAEGYTRITEYKKLPVQDVKGTTYAVEYPLPYKAGESNEPYYPVLTGESQELYAKYKALADKVNNLYLCGRLADFKYYNMDQALEKALELSEQLIRNN